MAKRRRDDLRGDIWELYIKHPDWTLRRIAIEVGLKDRQWVWYYVKDAKKVLGLQKNTEETSLLHKQTQEGRTQYGMQGVQKKVPVLEE